MMRVIWYKSWCYCHNKHLSCVARVISSKPSHYFVCWCPSSYVVRHRRWYQIYVYMCVSLTWWRGWFPPYSKRDFIFPLTPFCLSNEFCVVVFVIHYGGGSVMDFTHRSFMGIDIRLTAYVGLLALLEWLVGCKSHVTYQVWLWMRKCDIIFYCAIVIMQLFLTSLC